MQVGPLWPEELPCAYANSSPITNADPLGLACQRRNPCSELKGAQGACIALLCSFNTVDDMINWLKKGLNLDPRDLQGIIKYIRGIWGKKFGPEDCCEAAGGSGPLKMFSTEWWIRWICRSRSIWGNDPAWSNCSKQFPAGRGFGGDPEENDKCHACCFKQFPEGGPFDRLRGLCQKSCDGVG